jgi:hypothetical protein
MSWSKPYVSSLDITRKIAAESRENREKIEDAIGGPIEYKRFYLHEVQLRQRLNQDGRMYRVYCELQWYLDQRPFFRVYPIIERKILSLRGKTTLAEMRMPYPCIEINTRRRTMLFHKTKDHAVLVAQTSDDEAIVLATLLNATIDDCVNARSRITEWHDASDAGKDIAGECIRIAIGVCLLATDPRIVSPVILDKHRRDDMTPEEIERRAAQAVSRTGRVGFDVGREIERMPVTSHYRTGHPAIYYVGREHKQYPQAGTADREPVLIWRAGAVVNADRLPKVPTGFRDQQEAHELPMNN